MIHWDFTLWLPQLFKPIDFMTWQMLLETKGLIECLNGHWLLTWVWPERMHACMNMGLGIYSLRKGGQGGNFKEELIGLIDLDGSEGKRWAICVPVGVLHGIHVFVQNYWQNWWWFVWYLCDYTRKNCNMIVPCYNVQSIETLCRNIGDIETMGEPSFHTRVVL